MSENRTWLWILIASLVALIVGFGAAWLVQAQKIDAAEKALATSQNKASLLEQDLGDANKALDAAIAERDKLKLAAAGASSTDTSTRTPDSGTPKPAPKTAVTGRRFGYIKKFETKNGTVYVTYDQAEFLTGKAAAAAATAHGDESPPPNDYYIVNDNKLLRTYPVASSVKVTLTTEPDNVNPAGYASTLAKLRGAFDGSVPGLKNAKSSPYWLTLKNGVVTAIAEQYLP
jgi:hypothetical protein